MTKTTTTARIFITDYASYNDGSQFEFGKWIDLSDYSDLDELQDHLTEYFEECDNTRPIPGTSREEWMITDFEGFPRSLYSESWDSSLMEKVFKYIELDFENLSDGEKVSLWNEYCSENSIENEIYSFDDEFFDTFFSGKPMEAARAATFGSINWSDNYITFNGYGNLESFDDPSSIIDEAELLEWLLENR